MKTFVKVLWVIAGVILIGSGLTSFFNPLSGITTFEVICGFALAASGVMSIVAYCASSKVMLGAGWVLAEGILSLILGGIILVAGFSDGIIATEITGVLAMFVGWLLAFWLLFSGVTHITRSVDLHKLRAKGWGWGLVWGILSIICALAVFCKPVITALGTMSVVLGIVLIIGGVSILSRCFTRDIED